MNKNKFILKLDTLLAKIIPPEKVFVSYRGNKTIKETLVPSRLRDENQIRKPHSNSLGTNSVDETAGGMNTDVVRIPAMVAPTNDTDIDLDEEVGCHHCESGCKACRLFIVSAKTAKSFHSDYSVTIASRITCNTVGVCYLINDKVCRRSSVGSTITDFKTRWGNHKSHIRTDAKTCEISKHFNSEIHDLTKNPMKVFDNELSNQIEIILIEKVDFSSCSTQYDKVRMLKQRESYYQHQLNTLESFGGLNKRDSTIEI